MDNPKNSSENQLARDAIRSGEFGEAIDKINLGDLSVTELEESLRIYHAELKLQNEELQEAKERLARSERRFHKLFDVQFEPTFILSSDGVISEANEAALLLIGQPQGDLSKRPLTDHLHEQSRIEFHRALDSLQHNPDAGPIELLFNTRQGTASVLASMVRFDSDTSIAGKSVVLNLTDITRLRDQQRQLLEQSDFLQQITREVDGVIAKFSFLGHRQVSFDFVSHGVKKLFGAKPGAVYARPELVIDAIHPDDLNRLDSEFTRGVERQQTLSLEFRIKRYNNNEDVTTNPWFWVSCTARPLQVSEKQVAWFAYIQDISERREAQNLLVNHSRRAMMGDMLSTIVHQWKQPINALSLSLSNLEDALEFGDIDSQTITQHINDGRRFTQNMEQTIADFVDFFKPNKRQTWFKPGESIHKALELLATPLKREHISVNANVDDSIKITGQPNEFFQVVLVLIQNARESFKERNISNPQIDFTVSQSNSTFLLEVTDNAGGISEQTRQHIFQPHFSTREDGSGIGLYLAQLIIETSFNGDITHNNTANGSRFVLAIPLASNVD